eukprot:6351849-Heterocapsa_arctica.AAC.1
MIEKHGRAEMIRRSIHALHAQVQGAAKEESHGTRGSAQCQPICRIAMSPRHRESGKRRGTARGVQACAT